MTDFILHSLTSTGRFGRLLGELCLPGDIICLGGGLGAGKTTMSQAIALGAGVDKDEYVTSPSFAILHEYRGRVPFYHMDFYRLDGSDAIREMGLDEYFYLSGITIIEWYRRALDIIPEDHLCVDLTVLDEQRRSVSVSSTAKSWQQRLATLQRRFRELPRE